MSRLSISLFDNTFDSEDKQIESAALELAKLFSDDSEIPAKYKKAGKKKKKEKEDTFIAKRFEKKIKEWNKTITSILKIKKREIAWRFINRSPIIEKNIKSVIDCNDFNLFLEYLIQRRDIDNCSDEELGRLAMLHTSFQNKIEKKLESVNAKANSETTIAS